MKKYEIDLSYEIKLETLENDEVFNTLKNMMLNHIKVYLKAFEYDLRLDTIDNFFYDKYYVKKESCQDSFLYYDHTLLTHYLYKMDEVEKEQRRKIDSFCDFVGKNYLNVYKVALRNIYFQIKLREEQKLLDLFYYN